MRTTLITLLLCLAPNIALAACPSNFSVGAQDMLVRLKANTNKPSGTLSGTVIPAEDYTEGVLAYDATNETLMLCNGSTWITLTGSGAAGITTLTGDVTATGTGSVAATIANNAIITAKINNGAVSFAKIQTIPTQTLIGRGAAGTGVAASVTIGSGLTLSTANVLTAPGDGQGITALTGDVAATGTGSVAATIANSAVTFAKLQNIPTQTLIGRGATGSGDAASVTLGSGLSLSAANILTAEGDGQGITALTGEITATGTGSVAATIANNAVTTVKINNGAVSFAKIQSIPTQTLIGRGAAGSGVATSVTLGSGLTLSTANVLTAAGDGQGITALTGDITATGTGSVAATIANSAVTFAKLQNIPTQTLIGRGTAGTGDALSITLGSGLTLSTANVLTAAGDGQGITALTGDITATGTGSVAATIANSAVTFAKLQNIPTQTLIGRGTAGAGNAVSVTIGSGLTLSTANVLTAAGDGQGITALTGDITATGTGSVAATIANSAVTFAKLQNIPTQTLIGRGAAGAGNAVSVTLGSGLSLSTANVLTASGDGQGITALTGDVTASGTGSVGTTIANNAVTTAKINNNAVSYAKIQNMATNRLLGRATAGAGNIEELTIGTGLSLSGTTLSSTGITQSAADSRYARLTGSTFTGSITISNTSRIHVHMISATVNTSVNTPVAVSDVTCEHDGTSGTLCNCPAGYTVYNAGATAPGNGFIRQSIPMPNKRRWRVICGEMVGGSVSVARCSSVSMTCARIDENP